MAAYNIAAGVKAILDADAGVGAIADNRVYPVEVPDMVTATYPLVVFDVSYNTENELGNTSFQNATIELVSFAGGYQQAQSLAQAVEDALVNQAGEYDAATVRHVLRSSRSSTDAVQIADDLRIYAVTSILVALIDEF